MFATLGFSPASLKPPDRMLEKGGKAGSSSKQVPPRMWNTYNKPCATKGNASVWRAGKVLCYNPVFDD
jgi:hypothetical protein